MTLEGKVSRPWGIPHAGGTRRHTGSAGPGGMGVDRVLLLHGIARRSGSLTRLERAVAGAGYRTLNLDYPARRKPLEDLVEEVHRRADAFVGGQDGRVHFVTHSMGGLLARAYIACHRPPAMGRAVMLAPPSQGSEIADLLAGNRVYRRFFGPAGAQLGTRRDGQLRDLLGTVDYPLGVIAGDRSIDPLSWLLIPGPNDGRVCVARTRVDGMADHMVVHATHAMMMWNRQVMDQTVHFLQHGCFAVGQPADLSRRPWSLTRSQAGLDSAQTRQKAKPDGAPRI